MLYAKSLDDLYDYSLSFFGLPYIWGGEGPVGYDCSGLVQAILRYARIDPPGDQTADALYRIFLKDGIPNYLGLGSIAFFGSTDFIHHVGFCFDTRVMISASGGGSHVRTQEVARRMNASVKIEPIRHRPDFVGCIMPIYQLNLNGS